MADVFISYSKADRGLALKLSALLESHGYTTWCDSSLEPADKFRDKIMHEIDEARAVVSLWTENSVNSDWVRAEAGRAKSQGKLIPVKSSGASYDAIPLPFGEKHIEPLENDEKVLGAVDELLSQPAQQLNTWWRLRARASHQVLVWFGISGAAITVISGLKGIITLSHFAQLVVNNWHGWMQYGWSKIFYFLPHVSSRFALLFTVAAFAFINVCQSLSKREAEDHYVIGYGLLAFIAAIPIVLFLTFSLAESGASLYENFWMSDAERPLVQYLLGIGMVGTFVQPKTNLIFMVLLVVPTANILQELGQPMLGVTLCMLAGMVPVSLYCFIAKRKLNHRDDQHAPHYRCANI